MCYKSGSLIKYIGYDPYIRNMERKLSENIFNMPKDNYVLILLNKMTVGGDACCATRIYRENLASGQ